jgi:serine protease AprX
MRTSGQRYTRRVTREVEEREGRVLAAFWLNQSVLVEVTGEQLVELATRQDVLRVQHDKRLIAIALDVSRPLIQADQVETALGFNGAGVNVAVIDTGVELSHPALAAVAGTQLDFSGEGTGDFFGHGTHCAGVVASQDSRFHGVAPGATVHDYKVMDQNGSMTAANGVSAIQQAVTDGMDVLSNSWGFSLVNGAWTDPDGSCVLCQAADAAMAAGAVFVVAAGNEDDNSCGSTDTHIRCPGNARSVITIGATDDSDAMADFSSVGPTPDGRNKPDVAAPGTDIISCRASTGSDMGGTATPIDANFIQASGTSMATPHVAGVAALMLDKNSGLSPGAIKEILMSTSVDIGAAPEEMGSGRVDALAAVNAS